MSGFWPVSLLIDLDDEWWLPTPASYVATAEHLPRRARTLVHESIHFWQQLSHGYLLDLAEEDWRRLLEWEQGGRPGPGPLRERYRRSEGRHGFSVHDLWECEARFWEVLFVGPRVVLQEAVTRTRRASLTGDVDPDLAELARREGPPDSQTFDRAMQLSGGYAAPFAVVRELVGQRAALVVFPFLVHFALKTDDPVAWFDRFVDELAPGLSAEADRRGIAAAGWDQDLAGELYVHAKHEAERIAGDDDGDGGDAALRYAPDLFPGSGLADHPAYAWAFGRFERLAAHLEGAITLHAAICSPVFPTFRALLAGLLPPPCLRFRDRRTLDLPELFASGPAEELYGTASAVADVQAVQERWETFQGSLRAY